MSVRYWLYACVCLCDVGCVCMCVHCVPHWACVYAFQSDIWCVRVCAYLIVMCYTSVCLCDSQVCVCMHIHVLVGVLVCRFHGKAPQTGLHNRDSASQPLRSEAWEEDANRLTPLHCAGGAGPSSALVLLLPMPPTACCLAVP